MALQRLNETIFYILEKSIKTYRQFAQRNIYDAGNDITIDQWLVLKSLYDEPDITQKQIAKMVFKDYASVTRMIELLVKKGFIKRAMHPTDRRRFLLSVTKTGEKLIRQPEETIKSNRAQALKGISKKDIEHLNKTLNKIISNCNQ